MDSTLGPVLANISLCHFEEKWILNNFTTLALPFGFYTYTLTTPSPCLTVKTQHHSFCTTSITVTQISNSPLNLKRTVESLSLPGHSHQTPQSYFLAIYLPKEDLYRPVHKKGQLHTWEMQSKPHPHAHVSLYPHRFVTFSFALNLFQNGYPAGIVNCNFNDVLNKQQNTPRNPTTTVPKKTKIILVLPYLGVQSKIKLLNN